MISWKPYRKSEPLTLMIMARRQCGCLKKNFIDKLKEFYTHNHLYQTTALKNGNFGLCFLDFDKAEAEFEAKGDVIDEKAGATGIVLKSFDATSWVTAGRTNGDSLSRPQSANMPGKQTDTGILGFFNCIGEGEFSLMNQYLGLTVSQSFLHSALAFVSQWLEDLVKCRATQESMMPLACDEYRRGWQIWNPEAWLYKFATDGEMSGNYDPNYKAKIGTWEWMANNFERRLFGHTELESVSPSSSLPKPASSPQQAFPLQKLYDTAQRWLQAVQAEATALTSDPEGVGRRLQNLKSQLAPQAAQYVQHFKQWVNDVRAEATVLSEG